MRLLAWDTDGQELEVGAFGGVFFVGFIPFPFPSAIRLLHLHFLHIHLHHSFTLTISTSLIFFLVHTRVANGTYMYKD